MGLIDCFWGVTFEDNLQVKKATNSSDISETIATVFLLLIM